MFIIKNADLESSAMAETKEWTVQGWLIQTKHAGIKQGGYY